MIKFIVLSKINQMKRFFLVVLFSFFCASLFAQTDSLPVYQRFPTVPPFKLMVLPDSTSFTKDDLKEKTPTIIMVFSPDCDHCIHATESLLKHMDLFTKTQIVMATALSYNHIQKFYSDFNMGAYPNIKVGLDNSYFLGTFFQIHSFPSIYVYDKKGKFKAFFEGTVKWEKVAEALQ